MKLNNNDIESFYLNIKKEISLWAITTDGKKYIYTDQLLKFPELFRVLNTLRISHNTILRNARLSGKINSTIQYIVSDLDILPEFFIGPKGYLDDLYILCLCFKDLLNNPDFESESLGLDIGYIDKVLDDGKNMFSLDILDQINEVYAAY